MDSSYAEVGTEVVISFGNKYRYESHAQPYLCKRGLIIGTKQFTMGSRKIITWARVKTSYGSEWSNNLWWPVDDMILASDIDLLNPDQRERIK